MYGQQNHRQIYLSRHACCPHHNPHVISANSRHHPSVTLRRIAQSTTSAYQRPVVTVVEWPSLHTVAHEDGGAAAQIKRRMFASIRVSVPTEIRASDDEWTENTHVVRHKKQHACLIQSRSFQRACHIGNLRRHRKARRKQRRLAHMLDVQLTP